MKKNLSLLYKWIQDLMIENGSWIDIKRVNHISVLSKSDVKRPPYIHSNVKNMPLFQNAS